MQLFIEVRTDLLWLNSSYATSFKKLSLNCLLQITDILHEVKT